MIATRGRLEPLGSRCSGWGRSACTPTASGRGVGTALVHALLAVAEAADERLVALLGAPDYYRRFGFVPLDRARRHPPDPAWGEHFQARRLNGRRPQFRSGDLRGYADARSTGLVDRRTARVSRPVSGGGPGAG